LDVKAVAQPFVFEIKESISTEQSK
jgi:hypothetical protein